MTHAPRYLHAIASGKGQSAREAPPISLGGESIDRALDNDTQLRLNSGVLDYVAENLPEPS